RCVAPRCLPRETGRQWRHSVQTWHGRHSIPSGGNGKVRSSCPYGKDRASITGIPFTKGKNMDFELPYPDLTQERQGNTGTPGVWHFDSGLPGPTLMITSLIHGNELCGAWALKTLLASGLRPQAGGMILAFCNLDGYDRFDVQRPDASRYIDEDLNRVWQDERLAQANNRERRRAAELLPWVRRADHLLDLHSMHEPGKPLLLTGLLPRNIELARKLGAPEHVIVDAGHKDGVRLRDYGRFGDPLDEACALLIECGYHGDQASRR